LLFQRYQDTPGVEHIPVVQIDLTVPLKVPGKYQLALGGMRHVGHGLLFVLSAQPLQVLGLSTRSAPSAEGLIRIASQGCPCRISM
jgi:hypothetical protein